MTPTPQEHAVKAEEPVAHAPALDGERIVISGMSGLYPESRHVKEFSDILYNKINPVSSKNLRWTYNHPEAAQHTGSVPDLDRFDAQFFKVHYRLGNSMDPMSRKILEQAYNAIYDAGYSPKQLSGKKIGVFVGSCFSEAEKACFYDATSRSGFGITGCCKAMFANRISYWLNAKGPSMSIDEACCSSTAALEQAYLAMSRGDCEAAVVGGTYLCLHPQSSVHYGRIMKQSMDGKTKSFDQNADGCVKSEAINVLFLQKAKDALRIYADLLHAKTQFIGMLKGDTGPQYGFLRNDDDIVNFLNTFYEEARVPPQAVEYVEAFGSAVPEADKAELEAIDKVFCKGKENPLLVGSVISNIGYGEAASGISAITKVLLGYHTGQIAANLHCSTPRQDVVALREGRMRVVTEHQRFGRTYVGVNGMSVTGVNSHVLLHGHYKPKDLSRYRTNIPHLVTISARQDTVVKNIFENLKSRSVDPEELALLHNIHQTNISGHLGRGFIILDTDEENNTVSLCEKAEYFDDARRPLWFVYSGMGSQWAGMGTQLMRLPIFAAAIERCRQALEPKGIDIVHIITSTEKNIFDNILHSFVGIAAIQIGLTDVLRELGFVPDGIIGHSVGELGCAYADGCLTAEEMILSAYSRGLVSLQTPFIRGSMAAIGLGFEQIKKLCPPEIEVACHNGPESSTISGPADVMRQFVAELTAKGIFAKEVPCSNIAYHSRYIADAGPGLLKYLTEVIKTPRARSERWVSTSVPQDKWGDSLAQYSSAEYHTNNLLNPVLFEETLHHIPSNAVLVEVAPHGLLQAILKRSLPADCKNIALTRRGHPDNTFLLLEATGKLYMEGYNPKVDILYPKVEMPVSTGTPFLSHLIEWAHTEKWAMPLYRTASRRTASSCKYTISLHDKEHKYLQGHVIREKISYPFAATLVSVWDTLAMTLGVPKKSLSVEFRDLHLYAQPVLHDQTQLSLTVAMHRGTGSFEVCDNNIKVAKGTIVSWNAKDNKNELEGPKSQALSLTTADVYSLFSEREYSYSGEFRSIESANTGLSEAMLPWRDNWVTCIDGLLQLNVLRQTYDKITLPTHIRRLCIDVQGHEKSKILVSEDKTLLKAEILEEHDLTRCGGILIENIRYRNLPALHEIDMALHTLKFVSYNETNQDVSTTVQVFLQIVAENINKDTLRVVAITDQQKNGTVFDEIKKIESRVYGVNINYEELKQEDVSLMKNSGILKNADLVIVRNLSCNDNICQLLHNILQSNTYVITEEDQLKGGRIRPSALYRVVSSHSNTRTRLELARWRPTVPVVPTTAITVRSPSDLALLTSTRATLPLRHRLLILAPYPSPPGLKELVRCWRREAERNLVHLISVNAEDGNNFFLDDLPDIDLAFYVLDHGNWGGLFYVPVQECAKESRNVTLQCAQIGDFNSLNWMAAPEIAGSGITVKVHYAGLTNTDIKKANGQLLKYDGSNDYGMDFSGTTESGERVMGLVRGGAASSVVRAQAQLLWPVPPHWSLEDAATVPLAYAHALYCLIMKQHSIEGLDEGLKPGTRVLVLGGAGALGQAAISIALAYGCEVFTTVSDEHKKRFMLKLFPGLKAKHVISNSRHHTFKDQILNATDGEGCDLIISSAKGDLKQCSVQCTRFRGMHYDVSQLHSFEENFAYGMYALTKERSYTAVDFSSIFEPENSTDIETLHMLLSEGISRGYVRPLSRVTYAPHDVSRAFRLLAASRHRGRVLLDMREYMTHVQPRLPCNPDHCHIILMDEEMFGLQLADRLIARGTRKLHINLKDQSNAKFQFKLGTWRKNGVQVEVSSNSLKKENDVVELLHGAINVMGPIQGIFTITNGKQIFYETLITDLDSVSKRLCSKLRYFAVVNVGEAKFGQQVCVSRFERKLPSTMITLPRLNNDKCNRDAVNAVEQALCDSDSVLAATRTSTQRPDLLQQIVALTGVHISSDTPKHTRLEDLGITGEKQQMVLSFLRVYYNVELAETQTTLTVETLLHVDKPESCFEEVKGLNNFITYVDSDELNATTEMVFLPTVTSASLREDEFDVSQSYLCIVPGMEGHHERFRVLCERLKLPALVLQPGLDRPRETVRETAERYAQVLMTKTGLKNNFYLLGYETGVLVALEMAAILEDHGLTGTVYCLGYAPDDLKKVIEENISEYKTEEQLQNAVIEHMFKLMVGEEVPEDLKIALRDSVTWEQKLDVCMWTSLGRNMSNSAQYARALIDAALARITSARSHTVRERALRSQLVLLRAATAHAPSAATALQRHSQRPVPVHQLQAGLAHATKDIRCASIINEYLAPSILEEFENKNICDAYLLNATSFMAVHNDE